MIDKFGVPPASIPDWLALVGDNADGFPGVPRWGAKTSATVLRHYKHVKDIPLDHEAWEVKVRGAKGLATNLREHHDDALLFVTLATLRTDVALKESVDDLEWRGAHRDKLEALCDEIGMNDFVSQIPRFQDS